MKRHNSNTMEEVIANMFINKAIDLKLASQNPRKTKPIDNFILEGMIKMSEEDLKSVMKIIQTREMEAEEEIYINGDNASQFAKNVKIACPILYDFYLSALDHGLEPL